MIIFGVCMTTRLTLIGMRVVEEIFAILRLALGPTNVFIKLSCIYMFLQYQWVFICINIFQIV